MRKYVIESSFSLKQALKVMDSLLANTIFVEDNHGLCASISSGDVRRSLLCDIDLDTPVSEIMHSNPLALEKGFAMEDVRQIFLEKKISAIPLIDENRRVIDVLLRSDILEEHQRVHEKISASVVIMAGGKGTRLDPFTRILPKALIPVGNKSIIEVVMDEFRMFGIEDFYISICDKAEMIKAYFNGTTVPYSINFIEEKIALGTVGAVGLLPKQIDHPFFISNCDIIVKTDFSDLYHFHNSGGFSLTLVASLKHHIISYGVCELEKDGSLKTIKEKPEYDLLINTGMYVVDPEARQYIPVDTAFDITDLIVALKENNHRIGVYPVSEKAWIDIGQWGAYRDGVQRLKMLLTDDL